MRRALASLLLVTALPAFAGDKVFTPDTYHTHLGFKAKTVLFGVDGSFKTYKVDIKGDPDTLSPAFIAMEIDVASINTGIEARDNHLKSADFFDAAKYPKITFTSNKAWKQDDKVMVAGTFTMHGVSKAMTLAFDPAFGKNGAGTDTWSYESEFKLNRKDFNLGTADIGAKISLKDEVNVDIMLVGFFH
ncbi:MAG TPA: YceI family protein [Holophagaceae bacterium]|jgi:polyisoprenoid-binding protein YceI|nr:YceI family protein [Holophagaceae bacterium]